MGDQTPAAKQWVGCKRFIVRDQFQVMLPRKERISWESSLTTKAAAAAKLVRSGIEPRGLSRELAAAYVGVSVVKFDQLVVDGRMPQPKHIDQRRVWDRLQLDIAFSALPDAKGRAGLDDSDIWSRVAL